MRKKCACIGFINQQCKEIECCFHWGIDSVNILYCLEVCPMNVCITGLLAAGQAVKLSEDSTEWLLVLHIHTTVVLWPHAAMQASLMDGNIEIEGCIQGDPAPLLYLGKKEKYKTEIPNINAIKSRIK